jgi:hypothetical protein
MIGNLVMVGYTGGPQVFTGTITADSLVLDAANRDVILVRDAANTLAQRNGTNPQKHRWYATYTDASNNAYATINLGLSGTDAWFGTDKTGSGTAGSIVLFSAGTGRWKIDTSGHLIAYTDNTYDIGASGATRPRNLYLGGKATLGATSTGAASLNLPHGTAPSSPVDGDVWTTTAGLFVRINGSTVGPLS